MLYQKMLLQLYEHKWKQKNVFSSTKKKLYYKSYSNLKKFYCFKQNKYLHKNAANTNYIPSNRHVNEQHSNEYKQHSNEFELHCGNQEQGNFFGRRDCCFHCNSDYFLQCSHYCRYCERLIIYLNFNLTVDFIEVKRFWYNFLFTLKLCENLKNI